MLFTQDRDQMRQVFFRAWRHHQDGLPLENLEKSIVEVVVQHPEYHEALNNPEKFQHRDYLPELGETNPFLHMGMHLAVSEQLSIDQPQGIRNIYQQLLAQEKDTHIVQHRMMECLAQVLWQAQQTASTPSDASYLSCLKRLRS